MEQASDVGRRSHDLAPGVHRRRHAVGAAKGAQVGRRGIARAPPEGVVAGVAGDVGAPYDDTAVVDRRRKAGRTTEGAQIHHAAAARPREGMRRAVRALGVPNHDPAGVHVDGSAGRAAERPEVDHPTRASPREGVRLAIRSRRPSHHLAAVVDCQG